MFSVNTITLSVMYSGISVSLFLYYFVVTRSPVSCFNLEDRDPMVKKAPEEDSYFGYSVALHKSKANSKDTKDNWLLVGAPLSDNLQLNLNKSGALFKCPISNNDLDCEQVETDGKRVEDFDYGIETEQSLQGQGPDEIKTGQWLGVTVKSQRPGGYVMVCAHRYIQSPNLTTFHYGQGLCYVLNSDLVVQDSWQLCKGRPMEKLHQQFGYCQIGTSLAFSEDNFALVGAPGPYTWRGTVFGQVVGGDFLTNDKTIYHSPVGDIDDIEKYSYLGMSVGSGHFWDKKKIFYVAGAPRSKMIGEVYFFQRLNVEEFKIKLRITGEQFASSFGYELLAADVNNDGYDDLLVGAPFYYNDNRGGAVYIYYNIRECKTGSCEWDRVIYGKPRSRFGFALTSLGDINKDGYNDIAIGAPYEDDHGAVYVYLGSQNGLNEEPSQVIIKEELKTLGCSLSGGIDMDNNGYPDLLVGSYESEKVLLFKTRPIIDIKIKIDATEMKNINTTRKGCTADSNRKETCFSFKSCFTIVGKLNKNFNVKYHIEEKKKFVSRIYFDDKKFESSKLSVTKGVINVGSSKKEYCQSKLVIIKDGINDILSPIKFQINYTLENDNYHSPILNKSSVKDFEATFQKECGDDEICTSELILTAGTNLQSNPDGSYTINMLNEEFILEANITNNREAAYEAKLFVNQPKALSYIALKTDNDASAPNVAKCSTTNTTSLVICDIGNPFPSNRSINLKLRFEILKDVKMPVLDIKLFVNSTSKELSTRTSQNIVAIIRKSAKYQIRGKATNNNLFYGGKIVGESAMKYLEDIGVRVIHTYQIDNNGHWDLPDVKVHIQWPIQVSTGADSSDPRPGKWLLYLEKVPELTGAGAEGYCNVLPKDRVNELGLSYSIPEPENMEEYGKSQENLHSRKRRALNYVVPTETTEKGGKKRKIVVMDCLKGTAKCVDVVCTIKKLRRGNNAWIVIKSRLWNSTLVEDYSNVDWVTIRSHAEVEIPDKSFNISSDSIQAFSAETIAYPETVITDSGFNWWIIGGAILAGILLLIILVIILYKCGFFKRKRISDDPTLSGNLQKKEENDFLLTEPSK